MANERTCCSSDIGDKRKDSAAAGSECSQQAGTVGTLRAVLSFRTSAAARRAVERLYVQDETSNGHVAALDGLQVLQARPHRVGLTKRFSQRTDIDNSN